MEGKPGEPSPAEGPAADFRMDFTAARKLIQERLDKESKSLRDALTEKGVDPAEVEAASAGALTETGMVTDDAHRKYQVGDQVAKGGMGAILDVRDVNTRRHVAMKVLLQPEQAAKEDTLRFIHEAQVLAQLEHPNIVPLHELGVDGSGNPYYTMKFVKGRTLKDILAKIAEGDPKTIEAYPLLRLLTIFQRVCDAIAFAHSKRVIHRDLKPENIMIGEYGEVLVMDWGLAKVLGQRGVTGDRSQVSGKKVEAARKPAYRVDSVRTDGTAEGLQTMAGAVMGTPQYMAPEQAAGEVDRINDCTDIYALGAILYTILTLRPPVTGRDLGEILGNVMAGNIPSPTTYQTGKTHGAERRAHGGREGASPKASAPDAMRLAPCALLHLPGRRIPPALAAVAMKALSLKPDDRYAYVKFLQADIEAYQNGFATSVEQAGVWKQFTLLVKRNKGIFTAIAAAVVIIVAGSAAFMAKVMASERKATTSLAKFETEQDRRLGERKTSAPALYDSAKIMIEKGEFGKAEELLQLAREYNPGYAPSAHLLAVLLMKDGKVKEAAELLDSKAVRDAEGTRQLAAVAKLAAKGGQASMGDLATWASEQGLPTLALQFGRSGSEQFEIYKAKIKKAWPSAQFAIEPGGTLFLELSPAGNEVRSLEPLRGMPLRGLSLYTCAMFSDLSPLQGMPLTWLRLERTKVVDLSPLQGLPLTDLNLFCCFDLRDLTPLHGMTLKQLNLAGCRELEDIRPLQGLPLTRLQVYCTKIKDLTPLKGMPLTVCDVSQTGVRDLTSLKGMPLTTLYVQQTGVTDLSPLKGMPLTTLWVSQTGVTDLSPLKGMPLTTLYVTPQNITKGWEVVREMTTLTLVSEGGSRWTRDEFFKKLDAGEFNPKPAAK